MKEAIFFAPFHFQPLPSNTFSIIDYLRRNSQAMNLSFHEILTVSTILFAVIDIIGSIPAILSVRTKVGTIYPEKATLVSLLIMVVFLFIGQNILDFLGVDVASFAIAGSLVLFFLALEMILGIKLYKDELPSTASVVPIAFPLIAGTGTMTTLLSLRSAYTVETILIGIFLNIILVYLVLKNLRFLEKLLGPGGINIVRKVFGIILLAIAIKLFRSNVHI
jgi:multiple antibiotic resistance protein